MDGESPCADVQSGLYVVAMLFFPPKKPGLDRNYLLCRCFPLEAFKAGFPYAAETVMFMIH
ncbi:hypothetical protein D3Z60_27365 [Lachnospiraceae bacterium]|jgi:hypothetical protein|nr:hypothetical protein [Lachnospiraceae bacterium]